MSRCHDAPLTCGTTASGEAHKLCGVFEQKSEAEVLVPEAQWSALEVVVLDAGA